MHIDSYSFGRIVINGKTYTSDVLVFPERVVSPWWRRQGHLLQMEDLPEVIRERPDVLIVGKGFSGLMQVPQGLMDELASMGIEVIAERTTRAVRIFNDYSGSHLVAAFHLTC